MEKDTLTGNIQEGIIISSTDGIVEFVNPALLQMLQFDEDRITKQNVKNFVYDLSFREEWGEMSTRIQGGESLEGLSVRMVGNKGLLLPVQITCSSMKKPSEGECWLVFYIVDIGTDIDTNKKLADRNRVLARENSKLLKERSNFKRISEQKTKFLGIASHELKTPLTTILGYSEILLDSMGESLDPKVHRMIERISLAGKKLHSVVNDMLDVSRIEQNRLRLKPEQLNLKELITACKEELAHFLDVRSMEISIDSPSQIPLYLGDKTRLHQVFINLFSNAIKYSPDNTSIRCTISVEDDSFLISVKDQGVGIHPLEQENIFKPFYEIGNTANHSSGTATFMGGGTGLGLSIVRGIITQHGGEIWVVSDGPDAPEESRGSSFNILLPVTSEEAFSDDQTQLIKHDSIMNQPTAGKYEEKATPSLPGLTKRYRILIIDDDAETVEICRMIFGDTFDIVTSATGEVGLRIAFRDNPDLILLNIYLPGLKGTQICKILKSQEETCRIPVAFFSAATQDNEIEQCYSSGGDDFIVKPFSNRELIEKVRKLLIKNEKSVR